MNYKSQQCHHQLRLVGIMLLTLIFFGLPIYSTITAFIGDITALNVSYSALSGNTTLSATNFSDVDNYQSVAQVLISLVITWVYLHIRRFD